MNNNARQTRELISQMSAKITDSKATVLLCVPAINIRVAKQAAENSIINIGAENCHWAESGAYTGEISADMLDSYDVKYCIIGHSERRQYFGETDETVNLRRKPV